MPNHWVNKLDAIVIRRVVTGSDHDSDGLSTELPAAQCCKESYAEDNRVEEVTDKVLVLFLRCSPT